MLYLLSIYGKIQKSMDNAGIQQFFAIESRKNNDMQNMWYNWENAAAAE